MHGKRAASRDDPRARSGSAIGWHGTQWVGRRIPRGARSHHDALTTGEYAQYAGAVAGSFEESIPSQRALSTVRRPESSSRTVQMVS